MIKGLITVSKLSRDAAIMLIGIYVLVWAYKELNPAHLIDKAEGRQIAYVDRWVNEITKRLDRIEEKVDRLSTRSLATLPIESSNNKN